jgi:hypothetical protein
MNLPSLLPVLERWATAWASWAWIGGVQAGLLILVVLALDLALRRRALTWHLQNQGQGVLQFAAGAGAQPHKHNLAWLFPRLGLFLRLRANRPRIVQRHDAALDGWSNVFDEYVTPGLGQPVFAQKCGYGEKSFFARVIIIKFIIST